MQHDLAHLQDTVACYRELFERDQEPRILVLGSHQRLRGRNRPSARAMNRHLLYEADDDFPGRRSEAEQRWREEHYCLYRRIQARGDARARAEAEALHTEFLAIVDVWPMDRGYCVSVDLSRVAVHEAGHVVMIAALGQLDAIDYATIEPAPDYNGLVSWASNTAPGFLYKRRVRQCIMVSWAGEVAEELFAGCYLEDPDVPVLGEDYFRIRQYASEIGASEMDTWALRDRTEELLKAEMLAIRAVASQLELRREISGDRLAVILERLLS
jgi:hypothetical protein